MKQTAYIYMSKEELELREKNYRIARIYAKNMVAEGKLLNEDIVLEIHKTLMDGIGSGGFYREDFTDIDKATHPFPAPEQVATRMKQYYTRLHDKTVVNGLPESGSPIELAAWTHNEFLAIRPFDCLNGSTARLMLNYQLESCGYLPVNIACADYEAYSKMMDDYCREGDIRPFAKYLEDLEMGEINRQLKALNHERELDPSKRIKSILGKEHIVGKSPRMLRGMEL